MSVNTVAVGVKDDMGLRSVSGLRQAWTMLNHMIPVGTAANMTKVAAGLMGRADTGDTLVATRSLTRLAGRVDMLVAWYMLSQVLAAVCMIVVEVPKQKMVVGMMEALK